VSENSPSLFANDFVYLLKLRRLFHMHCCRKFCRYGTLDVEKVKGKIVVCLEDVYFGTIPDAEASSAGAVGMVLANDDESYYDFIAYPHALPTSQVNYIDSQYIYSYIKNEK